jgi:hypothetical protein
MGCAGRADQRVAFAAGARFLAGAFFAPEAFLAAGDFLAAFFAAGALFAGLDPAADAFLDAGNLRAAGACLALSVPALLAGPLRLAEAVPFAGPAGFR